MLYRLLGNRPRLFAFVFLNRVQQFHHSLEICRYLDYFLVLNFEVVDLRLQFTGLAVLALLLARAAPDLVHLPPLQLRVLLFNY